MEEEDGHLSLGCKVQCSGCNSASLSMTTGFLFKLTSTKFVCCFPAKRRLSVIDSTFQSLRKQRLSPPSPPPRSADFYVDLVLFVLYLLQISRYLGSSAPRSRPAVLLVLGCPARLATKNPAATPRDRTDLHSRGAGGAEAAGCGTAGRCTETTLELAWGLAG